VWVLCAAIGAFVALAVPLVGLQQRPRYRTGVDVVTVDVSVRAGGRPVRGLSAADFVLTDNGVRQSIEAIDTASLPIDLTLAVDTSGSMWPIREHVQRAVRDAAAVLRSEDRVRVLRAGTRVDASPFRPASEPLSFDGISPTAMTSILDSLGGALLAPRDGHRRHLVIAVTDGFDTMSALAFERLLEVSRDSEAVLHLLLLEAPVGGAAPMAPPPTMTHLDTRRRWMPGSGAGLWSFDRVAGNTGGHAWRIFANAAMPDAFRRVVDDFRAGYVLRYSVRGVPPAGWHDIHVAIDRRGSYRVSARAGYFGS
jgi:hypothetical protein